MSRTRTMVDKEDSYKTYTGVVVGPIIKVRRSDIDKKCRGVHQDAKVEVSINNSSYVNFDTIKRISDTVLEKLN